MSKLEDFKVQMCDLVRGINANGWSPATSTNYSFINPENNRVMVISRSGIDKSVFDTHDWLHADLSGNLLPEFAEERSSAETGIHVMLYDLYNPTVILHTHSENDTVFSQKFAAKGFIEFSNYEVLKGLPEIQTHEATVRIPIVPNDQDMQRFAETTRPVLEKWPEPVHGFFIEGHGLYTWGNSLAEAKRKLEVIQFLLACEFRLYLIK